MALPRSGEVIALWEHALKEIRAPPPEKPRRRRRPIWGAVIEMVQHRPHRRATLGQAALLLLPRRHRAVATFNRRGSPREGLAGSAAHACHAASTSGASRWGQGGLSKASCLAWSVGALVPLGRGQRVRGRCSCPDIRGSRHAFTHGFHLGGRAMCSTSCHTVCHQKSPRADTPGRC